MFFGCVKTTPLAVAVKINNLTDNIDIRRYEELSELDVKRLRKYLKAYRELTNNQKYILLRKNNANYLANSKVLFNFA